MARQVGYLVLDDNKGQLTADFDTKKDAMQYYNEMKKEEPFIAFEVWKQTWDTKTDDFIDEERIK